MQLPDRTLRRIARIGATDPSRVGRHGLDLLRHGIRGFAHGNGVVVGLGHLLPIQSGHLGCRCQLVFRLDQDDLATTFQITEQTLLVANRQALLFFDHGARSFQCLFVATLLIGIAHFLIERAALAAQFLDGGLGLFLETRFLAVDMVEAARDLAREFDVRNLVFADRYLSRLVNQDVGALQQGIAEKAVSRQILARQLLLLVLVGRNTLEPAQWRDHRKQRMQFGMLRYAGLDKDGGRGRIDSCGKPVDDHLPDAFLNHFRRVVMRCQSVPVRNKKQAFMLVLQLDPVFQNSVIMTQMQASRRTHAR